MSEGTQTTCMYHYAMDEVHRSMDRRLVALETVWASIAAINSRQYWMILLLAINCLLTGADVMVRLMQYMKLVHLP